MRALRSHRTILFLTAIVAGGLLLRAWGLWWGLHDVTVSRRAHPDEWVVYWVFHWFDRYPGLNPCPHAQAQCFFDWGGLYLYLAFALRSFLDAIHAVPVGAFGAHADHLYLRAVIAGRLLSLVLSTSTILLVYRLGAALRNEAAGLIAAATVAGAGLLIQLAHFATPDSTTIFFLTLALLLTVQATDTTALWRWVAAGAAAGLATGSEYHMALLLVPLTAAWLLSRPGLRVAAATVLAFVAAWVAANPYAVLQPSAFIDANLHSLRLRTVDSGEQYGDRWASYGPAWLYVVRYPLGYGVGPLITVWLGAGAVWACLVRRRRDLIVLLWVALYLVLVSLSPAKFMRYSAPLIPALAALGGAMGADLWSARSRLARPILLAAGVAAALYSLTYDAAYAGLFTAPDPRQTATAWIERHAPASSRIGFEELPDGLVNLPYFVTDAGYRPCFAQFSTANLKSSARYFLVDQYSLEQHPNVPNAAVREFRAALAADPTYVQVFHVEPVPTVGPFRFPIDRSPHDWRYPARGITVYRNEAATPQHGQCFTTLRGALAALYIPPPDAYG